MKNSPRSRRGNLRVSSIRHDENYLSNTYQLLRDSFHTNYSRNCTVVLRQVQTQK